MGRERPDKTRLVMQAVHIHEHKPTPQATELEQQVLGAMMLEKGAFAKVSDHLIADHFYQQEHALIYEGIRAVINDGGRPDPSTVSAELHRTGMLEKAGGPLYLSRLLALTSHANNLEWNARIIQQKFVLRTMRTLGSKLVEMDEDEDVFDVMDFVNEQVGRIQALTTTGDPVNAAELIAKMVDDREMPLYITASLGQLDDHFAMGPNHITVIGARPAVGKTAFALNMAMNIAMQGHAVMFITLEMSGQELAARISSSLTGVDSERITRNELNEDERERIAKAAAYNGTWIPRIIFEDRATMQAGQAFGIFQKAANKYKCKVAILDYLQLVSVKEDGRYEKMTAVSIALKQAAKATGIRLIEISQLSRGSGNHDPAVNPRISDLRESGQIEADADTVILLGREKGSEKLVADVVKNKKGPVGSVDLVYNLSSQRIGPSPAPSGFNMDKTIEPNREEDIF